MTLYGVMVSFMPYVLIAVSAKFLYKICIAPFLSPLRKIPGRPYKPIVGNMLEALGAEAMDNTINWMREYKSRIVRFYFLYGECRVLVADPDLVRHVMVTHSKNYRRSSSGLNNIVPGFVILLDGDEHHALRKLMNPAFNSTSTNEFVPIFEETARKVVKLWRAELEKCGGKEAQLPAQDYITRLTLEAICRCGFGFGINSVEDPQSAGVQSFQRILSGLQIKLTNMLPFQRMLPTKSNKQLWADSKVYHATINDMIARKRQQIKEEEGTSCDLLSRLLQAKDDQGKPLSDERLFGQVGGFLFAGFETTSMNLTWTLLLLAQHPDVQEKARQEVTEVIANPNQPITSQMLDQLTYLTCVIRESLRLYPPATVIFRRAAKADILGGYEIPAGTAVGVSVGALHRLPENWDDPLAFRPERFLAPHEQWSHKFLPFNTGPYMCIGHIFSMTEAKVTLALLLHHFHMTLPTGYTFRRTRQLTLQPKPALSLIVRPVSNLGDWTKR